MSGSLNQKVFQIDIHFQMENLFSPKEYHKEDKPYLRVGPTPKQYMVNTKSTHGHV